MVVVGVVMAMGVVEGWEPVVVAVDMDMAQMEALVNLQNEVEVGCCR